MGIAIKVLSFIVAAAIVLPLAALLKPHLSIFVFGLLGNGVIGRFVLANASIFGAVGCIVAVLILTAVIVGIIKFKRPQPKS